MDSPFPPAPGRRVRLERDSGGPRAGAASIALMIADSYHGRRRVMDYALLPESLRPRIQANNERAVAALVKQLRSPLGVMPFLGAGVSAPLKYRQWGSFLASVAREQLSAKDRAVAEDAIGQEDFLRAADLIAHKLGEHDFQQVIAEEFSDDRLRTADLSAGTLGYLPLITAGPVITTNFDRVIEHVFERAGRPFADRVYGANPDEAIPAIQQNRLVLWKIHGDRGDRRTRVLSDGEYTKHYADLSELLVLAFLNRPALFIGCSLDKDRTTQVLASIRARHPWSNHYAFLQIPESDARFDERVEELRVMGVRPIWYPSGQHHHIEEHLADLVHAVAAIQLPTTARATSEAAPLTAEQALAALVDELGALDTARPPARGMSHDTPPYTPIIDRIVRGQMAFFLGSGACLERLPLGKQFYDELITTFDEDADGPSAEKYGRMEPERITQHFADKYGRDTLYSKVDDQLAHTKPNPTAIHWFIATLPQRLAAKGYRAAPPWIVTTNYDEWMESALQRVGLRYHLFAYRRGDPHAGSFIYQRPDGAVHVVDRPSHLRRLSGEFPVLVKLHGGLLGAVDLPISYAFTHRDFVELAGRIPGAIPQVILDGLARRSLLCLGSGLGDDSIESLVRHTHANDSKKLSWAIQWKPRPEKRLYWRQFGMQIVDITLEAFMPELNRRLEALKPSGPVPAA